MTQQDIDAITEIVTSTQNVLSEQLSAFKTDIDARFGQIDLRFAQIDARFDRIEFRMDRFEGRLEQLESDTRRGFDRVNTTLDGIAGRLDEDDAERVALSAQVTRHEDWLVENAPTLGVTYTPGA